MLRNLILPWQAKFHSLYQSTHDYPSGQFTSTRIPADRTWPLCKYFAWRKQQDKDRRLIQFEDKLGMKELARAADVPCVLTLGILPLPTLDLGLQPCLQRERFVLKTNHGWNDLVFVERIAHDRYRLSGKHLKGDFSLHEANNALRKHFRWWINSYHLSSEWAVTQIAPRLLFAEPLLELNDDYKLFVVGGKVLWIDAMTGRWENDRSWGGLFDSDWNLISYTGTTQKRFPDNPTQAVIEHFPRPPQLQALVNYAERVVPNDMSLMRVDFFQQPNGTFVLGESAAYSNAGRPHHTDDLELLMGQMVFDEMEKRGFLAAK